MKTFFNRRIHGVRLIYYLAIIEPIQDLIYSVKGFLKAYTLNKARRQMAKKKLPGAGHTVWWKIYNRLNKL